MRSNYDKLGKYIQPVDVRNSAGTEENLLGVTTQKYFMPSIANTVGTDFSKYKVVRRGQFTYVPDTSRRGDRIAIALLQDWSEGLVSNIYTVFEVTDEEKLLPECDTEASHRGGHRRWGKVDKDAGQEAVS
ncbi:MAG: hypothetical protein LBG97_03645 [Coriobacteriales bacterium]|jgi:type I restriction enzyme S subunit|nr:hypothetical protein [Coriobacteriales bacterium]